MIKSQGPIGSLKPNEPITIVGGGISGLLMGYYLKKNQIPFKIIEKESSLGGKIGTKESQFGFSEKAANAVFSNDDVIELLKELGLEYYSADRKLKKIVWREGRAKTPPFKILEVIKTLFSLPKKINQENIEKISVKNFFLPLMGRSMSEKVLASALGGVYAKDIGELHFKSIFKEPLTTGMSYFQFFKSIIKKKKEQKHKATSISFNGGMQALINKLKTELAGSIQTDSEFTLQDSSNCIICTDATDAAAILEPVSQEVAKYLRRIDYTAVTTATLFSKHKIPFLDKSFGILFQPLAADINSLGILSNSEIYPNRTKTEGHHSYTFIVKGINDIQSKIQQDLQTIHSGVSSKDILETNIVTWERGIPVYNLERYEAILKVRTEFLSLQEGIVLFGNYIDGISIREILTMAKSFAASVGTVKTKN